MASSLKKIHPLGEIQRCLLRSLKEHKHWYPGGGWNWDTMRGTQRRLEILVARGLVEKKVLRLGSQLTRVSFDQECYVLTPAGRQEADMYIAELRAQAVERRQ
jgi:hypothetical protein